MTEQFGGYDDLIPKRRREDAAPGYADLVPERAIGPRPYGAPRPQDLVDLAKEGGPALLRGAINTVQGLANMLPETLNLALQSPPGLNPYKDPQLPTADLPKPAAPETEAGKFAELAGEWGLPLVPVTRIGKAAHALLKVAGRVAPEMATAARVAEKAAELENLAATGAWRPFEMPSGPVATKAPRVKPGWRPMPSPSVSRETIGASEAATRAADALTPEVLAQSLARKELPAKVEGFSTTPMSADEAVKRTQIAILEAGKGFREARRSGTTFKEIRDGAASMGMSPDDLLKRPIAKDLPERITKAQQIAEDETARFMATVKLLDPADPTAVQAYQQTVLRSSAVMEQVSAGKSEIALALVAQKIQRSPSLRVQRSIENITSGKFGVDPAEQIRMLQTLDDPVQVARFMRKLPELTNWDKFKEWYREGLMSGPLSQVKNFGSSALTTAWTVPARLSGAAFGIGSRERIYFSESLALANGYLKAMRTATENAWKVFYHEVGMDPAGKVLEGVSQQAIKGKLGYAVRTPGRAMEAGDVWWKTILYSGETEALALRQAIKEGVPRAQRAARVADIIANPSDDLVKQAHKFARENTFTTPLSEQRGITAKIASAIQNVKRAPSEKNRVGMAGALDQAGSVAAHIVFPFIRTPLNIYKWSVKRSPFGFLMSDVWVELSASPVRRQAMLGEIALGSAAAGTFAYQAFQGNITGAGPSEFAARKLWLQDHQPYSFKINGKWHSFAAIEPVGTLGGIAADFGEITRKLHEGTREKTAAMISLAFARNAKDKTFMQAASTLMKAIDDVEGQGEKFIQGVIGSLVPTGSAQIARALDPVVRDVRGIMDRIKARIPVLSESVPPLVDFWGNVVKREQSGVDALFNPIYVKTDKNDPVVNEMLRLGVSPRMPEREIADVRLTPEQWIGFVRAAGAPAYARLLREIGSSEWATTSDAVKIGKMEAIITGYRAAARSDLIRNSEALKEAYKAQRRGPSTESP